MIIIKGIPASPGIAIGKAYVLEDEEIVVERREIPRDKIRAEVKRFRQALEKTQVDLDAAKAKVLHMLGKQHAKLIDTHRLILKDPLITREVTRKMVSEQINAEFALSETLDQADRDFEKIEDEFFRERKHDLFDVGKRLLGHLTRQTKKPLSEITEPAVIIAHNLYPSDTLHLRESRVLGFCMNLGNRASHTAILAQSMEIPAVVGLSDVTRQVKTGDTVIVDGEQGLVIIAPGPEAVTKYQKAQELAVKEERHLENLRGMPSVTRDGHKVALMANVDTLDDIKNIVALKTDGIGLLRTEFLYLNRNNAPEEEEHLTVYKQAADALAPLPVVIRTADIGGDRLTEFGLGSAKGETNPFMGLRGVRLFLRHPDLMKTQLRAMLMASVKGNVKIMLPMIASLGEIRAVKKIINEIKQDLVREGMRIEGAVALGIMVEIPAAALTLDLLLTEADFVSIGTNDLIQYILAVDRINQHVSQMYDPFHPAVLRIINLIVQSAHQKGKTVSVCGEMASDPKAVPILVGLGVDILSVSQRMFLRIKHAIRGMRFETCSAMMQNALGLPTSDDVQKLLASTATQK
ncbi:MAG: phosphoenolpyruvate--protein phosphotransferase [bacterium]